MSERHVIKRTVTESFTYDPQVVDALWFTLRDGFPEELIGGDEDTNADARVIAMFSALDGSLASPFESRDDWDIGHELYTADDDE